MQDQQIGRYRITREIGRGAMGIVYAALDPVIGRTVAIKTIHLTGLKGNTSLEELRDRLHREAQTAGILSHPGIITIYDIGSEGDQAYIVMEYVDGRSLEEVFASRVPQHTGTLLQMLRKSAEALDYAHSQGIIHRDIKPSNVMVTKDGGVKIADFGIAKFSTSTMSMTHTGFVLGTPNYMSPEQAQARPIDGRTDQFSLAVLAYRVLTGKLPFDAPTLTAVLSKLLWEQPGFHYTELDPSMRAVLGKALAKDPAQRYTTCTEFIEELERAYASCRPDLRNLDDTVTVVSASPLEPEEPAAPVQDPSEISAPPEEAQPPSATPVLTGAGNEDETATDFSGEETESETLPPAAPLLDAVPEPATSPRGRSVFMSVTVAVTALAVVAMLAAYIFLRHKTVLPEPAPVSQNGAEPVVPEPAPPVASESAQATQVPPPDLEPAPSPEPPKTTNKPPVRRTAAKKTSKSPPVPEPPVAVAPAPPAAQPVATAPVEIAPAAPAPKPPAAGTITWTGRMQKNSVLVISNSKASFGTAAGAFPGVPIKLEIEPATVQVREPPNPGNGWKQLMLYSGDGRFTSIVIRWTALQ